MYLHAGYICQIRKEQLWRKQTIKATFFRRLAVSYACLVICQSLWRRLNLRPVRLLSLRHNSAASAV